MGWAAGRRRIVAAVIAVGVAATVGVIAYRVLAPVEVSTPARDDYPALSTPVPGVTGRLPVAPLIVDGRLRVYAGPRQVYADQPVDSRSRRTPYWSHRRWPASLDAVVASGTTVVSRWSDGQLVAIDARTGRVAWRADGPEPAAERVTRRTGTAVVWRPSGLSVSRTDDDRHVVVSSGDGEVQALDLTDGGQLWRAAVGSGCREPVGSGTGGRLLTVDDCDGPAVVEFRDTATGVVTARWRPPNAGDRLTATLLGCGPDRVDCAALRTAGPGDAPAQGWLLGSEAPVQAPALDGPGIELVDGTAVDLADGILVGRAVPGGEERWRAEVGPGRVIAVQPGRVHVLTEANELVTVDPATGARLSGFVLDIGSDGTGWAPGDAYAADDYVVVERLRRPVDPDGDDQRYYLTAESLIIAAT
ncbi:PQQ-binding-like beta-propeller repeat protein [Verrucosispora sp. WMMD573]|uniref:outer membrane protein assembly factor BamB family protein n=1 Tax=Verrucosispora sp. WMMD573 TaxID=3015149 RepID=UPI00248BB14D|nr:PQQ-binding-like beta-propeller repeat protein [Verrucosispora sp. WMMD573]WBB55392.1 PQQ-binding-like beta-propeller repeat protein [Verrucosispora sp. WMMD573]